MAIKGKGRTLSRRVVAAPPRPQLMVRKPPVWRRPLTWVIVGAVLAGAIGYGVWRTISNHRAADLKAQEIAAVEKYNGLVVAQYPQDQQQSGRHGRVPPGTDGALYVKRAETARGYAVRGGGRRKEPHAKPQSRKV